MKIILWFLRLFPIFRDLEGLVDSQARVIEQTDPTIAALREKVSDLESRLETAERDAQSARTDLAHSRAYAEEVSAEATRTKDRLEAAIADKEWLRGFAEEAINNERYALRGQINHLTQRNGAGLPYPDAPSLPENRIPQPQAPGPIGRRGRILPSEAMFRQEQKNIHEYAAARSAMEPET